MLVNEQLFYASNGLIKTQVAGDWGMQRLNLTGNQRRLLEAAEEQADRRLGLEPEQAVVIGIDDYAARMAKAKYEGFARTKVTDGLLGAYVF